MNRCDFCRFYDPFKKDCNRFVGSTYCDEAISKMEDVLKNLKVENPEPSVREPKSIRISLADLLD